VGVAALTGRTPKRIFLLEILRDVQARIEDELHREELLKDHLAMLQERHRVRNSQIRAALIILAFHSLAAPAFSLLLL
jgi:REP element-mobilizing transposase RayT